MFEKFPNMMKKINLQNQELLSKSQARKTKKTTIHIIIKLLKSHDKHKILKQPWDGREGNRRGNTDKNFSDF